MVFWFGVKEIIFPEGYTGKNEILKNYTYQTYELPFPDVTIVALYLKKVAHCLFRSDDYYEREDKLW